MIVVRLIGGIGNQMFQYAAARHLAGRLDAELRVDTGDFRNYRDRASALHHFDLDIVPAPGGLLRRYAALKPGGGLGAKLRRAAARLAAPGLRYYAQPGYAYDPEFFALSGELYLDGYFQNEAYFADVADQVRSWFRVREPLAGEDADMAGLMSGVAAVSVHVRRGDYVNDAATAAFHGGCGQDYYRSCAQRMREALGDPRFFVFSDDPDWAAANMGYLGPITVVRHNPPDKGYADMRLMSLCQGHIMANSSFSWWGAWLCVRPGRIILAPRHWFADPSYAAFTPVPDGWTKV